MTTTRYAYIHQGKVVWGPGPNPYFITLTNGDIWEISAHSVQESEDKGIFVVQQVNQREFDERFEVPNLPDFSIVGGRPVETWTYRLIESARKNMLKAVDEHAEKLRASLATILPGQYQEYDEVYAEALEVVSLPENQTIVAGTYKYLDADVNVTFSAELNRPVANVREAAELVIDTRNDWKEAGANIRAARLATKKAIKDAATDAQAFAIYKAYINQS